MAKLPPDEVLLMGPGPSPVHPRVLEAMSWPTLGHLDPEFLTIMNETMDLLRFVFQTRNRLTLPISGTGSAGMEAALVNFIEPGDRIIVCVNGVFGTRMADIVGRCGGVLIEVKAEWGRAIDPDDVEKALDDNPGVKAVCIVHAETSTGVLQPLEPVVELAHDRGALVVVDTVTSLGGIPVKVDDRGLDVVYSGTQKCLSCPPGLAPLTVGDRAMELFGKRSSPVQSWYLDLGMLTKYWGKERVYHHTAPVNMIYALHEALALIEEEGLEPRFERHRVNSAALVAGLKAYGMSLLPPEEERLPSLTAVLIPDGVDDAEARKKLRFQHGIEIGGGLGDYKGRLWRIGLMGHGSRRENVERALRAIGAVLNDLGHKCSADEALAEVDRVYRTAG